MARSRYYRLLAIILMGWLALEGRGRRGWEVGGGGGNEEEYRGRSTGLFIWRTRGGNRVFL
jgi:hypothetical protein